MKILSLFDGMACGYIAMQNAGVEIESYDAYEIDKYAIQTATHNFPQIVEHGDVFNADFAQYAGVDFLIGGSPCTHWSIAQTQNRETTVSRDEKGQILLHSSGIGFELFSQYLRALDEAKPKYFIYENNKSMSKEIRAAITECFGFEPVCINSALVSAQNRQRLYWVGIRNADGTYSKVHVEQPEDRGILLKDVLDSAVAWREKAYTIDANYYKTAGVYDPKKQHSYSRLQAAVPLDAEPVKPLSEKEMDYMVRDHQDRRWNFCNKPGEDDKSKVVTANTNKGVPYNVVAEPININEGGKSQTLKAQYAKNSVSNFCCYESTYGASGVAEPITDICQVGAMPMPNGELSTSAGFRVYSTEAKGRYLCANGGGAGAKTGLYAIPYVIEFDSDGKPIKAIGKNGKEITIYEVRDGKITIKGKQYPIKLVDGYYIIRKLTVSECKRLQTVPEWYEFPVSDSQAFKMLGNGWTCDIISFLIQSVFNEVLL